MVKQSSRLASNATMKVKLVAAAAALLANVWWVGGAFAQCFPGQPCETYSPEFDGSAAIAVVSLLASVCALIYSRAKR